MIPVEHLDEWLALSRAATPGPWNFNSDGTIYTTNDDENFVFCPDPYTKPRIDDSKFTAISREAMPALIVECLRLQWAIRGAGGLCKCGHVQDTHRQSYSQNAKSCDCCDCIAFEE